MITAYELEAFKVQEGQEPREDQEADREGETGEYFDEGEGGRDEQEGPDQLQEEKIVPTHLGITPQLTRGRRSPVP